jgi:hypothetical protein
MPFRILQEEKEEIPEPVWNNRGTVQNQLYDKNNEIVEDLMTEGQTVVPIAPPSL